MQIYLVGGAVRDELLGLHSSDRDWLVVGATPQQMLSDGYTAVGKDFPVFLHPRTKEEYALARTERKSGPGYTGFDCYFAPDVTLEQDLKRRDLTINAIAKDHNGTLYDPYHGAQDIENKLLRHVSAAFVEDPLRVLRVARFAAKLAHLGFSVAPETMQLMQQMVANGELNTLTAERVWQEWHKSLLTPRPDVFIQVLHECGALAVVMPELAALFGVPQPKQHHPEVDTGIHTLLTARAAAELSTDTTVRFAAQLHDLGKGVTPQEQWPSHKRHCATGPALVETLCRRIKTPNEFRHLALLVSEQHTNIHRAGELRAATITKILDRIDVWRNPEILDKILLCCRADHNGRSGFSNADYPQEKIFKNAYQAAQAVDVKQVMKDGFKGQQIRQELTTRRSAAIAALISK